MSASIRQAFNEIESRAKTLTTQVAVLEGRVTQAHDVLKFLVKALLQAGVLKAGKTDTANIPVEPLPQEPPSAVDTLGSPIDRPVETVVVPLE